MDELLAEVEAARRRVHEMETRLARQAEESAERLAEAERREAQARHLVTEAKSRAAEEAQSMLREAESLVKETRRSLTEQKMPPSAAVVEDAGRRLREQKREAERHRQPPRPEKGADYPSVPREEIRAGSELWSIDLGGVVIADESPSGRGMVHVVKSGIRFAVSIDRLRRVPRGGQPAEPVPPKRGGVTTDVRDAESVSPELDLRGLNGAEAVDALERYLDGALLGGVPIVRLIHGKGTGVLRQRVVEVLQKHFGVLSFRAGEPHEGGAGVTIAQLGER
jgi:DNA mismatch repair protein MutS2